MANVYAKERDLHLITQFIHHFRTSDNKDTTIVRKLSSLRVTLKWCLDKGTIEERPFFPRFPKLRDERFIPPNQEEISSLFLHSPSQVQRIIILGTQLGMRVGATELRALKWSTLDMTEKVVYLKAARKNRREPLRDIPAHESLIKVFHKWLAEDSGLGTEYVVSFRSKPVKGF